MNTFDEKIVSCTACPRLVAWRNEVAHVKRKQFMEEHYWGKPVPSFGPIDAQLLIVGLAPAAHGANRTGRMFTGDESGKWLYRAMYRAGFANQETSAHIHDGLTLNNARITAMVHCAPPGNKPLPQERNACASYFEEELSSMKHCRVLLCLGQFAWSGVLMALSKKKLYPEFKLGFAHGASVTIGPYTLLASYHPSQQNTFTKRLTEKMLDDIFIKACLILGVNER